MYYKLNEIYWLRGWEKLPYVLINHKNGEPLFLSQKDFEILSLCDGEMDVDSVFVDDKQRSYIKAAQRKGFVTPCSTPSPIAREQCYHRYPARYVKMAHWSITGRCNFRCKHCYMSAPDAKFGELSHEACLKIIDELAACGVLNLSITGGEALVRKDFWELIDAMLAKKLNIRIIYSNGKLVNDDFLDKLEARGLRPEINMSYDGVGWCDWLRGVDGAEEMVLDAFRRCQKRGFPTGAELCLHQRNRDTLRASVNLLASLGCGHIKTNPVAPVGEWLKNCGDDTLSIAETYAVYLDYIPHFFEDGAPTTLMLGGFFHARKGATNYIIPAKKYCGTADDEKKCICGHARMVMYIAADGRILPCMSLSGMAIQEDFPMVTEIGLKACLNDSSFMDMVNLRLKDYLEHNEDCRICEHRHICGGGCRASALQDSTDFLDKDKASCLFFRGHYEEKIQKALSDVKSLQA